MPGDRAREARNRVENATDRASSQARGTYRNTRSLFGSFAFDKVLPSGIADFLSELFRLIPNALGRNGPKKQVYASTTLIIIAIVATPFTLGYSLALAALPALTLLVGLARLVPAINSGFSDVRGNNLRDRDIPLWKRD